MLVVAVVSKQIRNLSDIDRLIERRGISNFTLVSAYFALKALNQVTNGHSTGNGVRVDDDVWSDALTGEGHVLQSKNIMTASANDRIFKS